MILEIAAIIKFIDQWLQTVPSILQEFKYSVGNCDRNIYYEFSTTECDIFRAIFKTFLRFLTWW